MRTMRRMKKILCVAFLFACVGCAGTDKKSDGPVKYQAYCQSEGKPLSDYNEDRSIAVAAREKHLRLFAHHPVTIWGDR